MLMKDKKQGLASIIVSKINDRGESEEKKMEAPVDAASGAIADVEQDGVSIAADEVFAAIEAKDKGAFIDSMRSMIEMCMDDYEDSEDEAE